MWPAAKIDVRSSTGCEHSEALSREHLVVLYLASTRDVEVRFDDGSRARTGSEALGSISVHPAGLRYEARRLGGFGQVKQQVMLSLEPGLVEAVSGSRRCELVPSFGGHDALAEQLLRALAAESQAGEAADRLYGESLLVALAAHLTRRHARPREAGRLDGLRAFIEERLAEPLTLEALAAFAQCDVRSFTRWFSAELGMPPHQFVLRMRVERSKALLLRTRKSLGEIALECGFSSQSHFTTVFRKRMGMTPGKFRGR